MEGKPVIFLDSGIGSIPYAHFFHSRNKNVKLILVGDRANFPYGPKSKEKLTELLLSLVSELINKFNPALLVIACNTATISAIESLRNAFPFLPMVGTVPAIKPAALFSHKRTIGVLGTQRTIDDPYIRELAAQFGLDCSLIAKAAPDLVDFVEHRWYKADREERMNAARHWVDIFKEEETDTLVLSCTHFLLLREEFKLCGKDKDIEIFDSLEGVVKRTEFLMGDKTLSSDAEEEPVMMITGEEKAGANWEEICSSFGFSFGENIIVP